MIENFSIGNMITEAKGLKYRDFKNFSNQHFRT